VDRAGWLHARARADGALIFAIIARPYAICGSSRCRIHCRPDARRRGLRDARRAAVPGAPLANGAPDAHPEARDRGAASSHGPSTMAIASCSGCAAAMGLPFIPAPDADVSERSTLEPPLYAIDPFTGSRVPVERAFHRRRALVHAARCR
jgi:hypothetical protein